MFLGRILSLRPHGTRVWWWWWVGGRGSADDGKPPEWCSSRSTWAGVVRCGARVAVSGECARNRQAPVHRSQIEGGVAMSRGGGSGSDGGG
jgi:hypothetical protein